MFYTRCECALWYSEQLGTDDRFPLDYVTRQNLPDPVCEEGVINQCSNLCRQVFDNRQGEFDLCYNNTVSIKLANCLAVVNV